MLQEQIQVAAQDNDITLLALIRERERRRRRWWVRPRIERRRLLGQYETLFQELQRGAVGNFVGYMRNGSNLFAEQLRLRNSLSGGVVARDPGAPGSNPVQDLKMNFNFMTPFESHHLEDQGKHASHAQLT